MINYDRIYVEIKYIKLEYPVKPCKTLGIECLNFKSSICIGLRP